MAVEPSPVEVRKLAAERSVAVTWDDGHESRYPWEYLRGWCPCAECQGHTDARRFNPVSGVDLEGIAPVGRYALTCSWSDGHAAGIYTFAYLRSLCPCPTCRRP